MTDTLYTIDDITDNRNIHYVDSMNKPKQHIGYIINHLITDNNIKRENVKQAKILERENAKQAKILERENAKQAKILERENAKQAKIQARDNAKQAKILERDNAKQAKIQAREHEKQAKIQAREHEKLEKIARKIHISAKIKLVKKQAKLTAILLLRHQKKDAKRAEAENRTARRAEQRATQRAEQRERTRERTRDREAIANARRQLEQQRQPTTPPPTTPPPITYRPLQQPDAPHRLRQQLLNLTNNNQIEPITLFTDDHINQDMISAILETSTSADDFGRRMLLLEDSGILQTAVNPNQEAINRDRIGATKTNILQLVSNERAFTQDECPVCFDNIGETNQTILRCGHQLCTDCIFHNLQTIGGTKCPVCREQICVRVNGWMPPAQL